MTVSIGDRIPDATLRQKTPNGVATIATSDYFAGRTVALFGVPGAFTPGCSDVHLPGFLVASDSLKESGVDEIACVAVNDAHVMEAWSKATGAGDRITFLADGSGELAESMGTALDLSAIGLGVRTRRFAALVRDGALEYLGVEPGREIGVSSADALLEHLRGSESAD